MRKSILYGLLILMICAFAYDQLVAKKRWNTAWKEIDSVGTSSQSGTMTNEKIQELVGRSPGKTYSTPEHPKMVIEKYSWRRGLLFLTHDIYVVYSKAENRKDNSTTLFYYSASVGKPPSKDNFPTKTVVPTSVRNGEKPTDDELQVMAPGG